MASSSTAFNLKDAGFFVKNVPLNFEEWDLFNAFAVHGLVGYCRLGGTSQDKTSQFGFVNMLTVEAADKVREHLNSGNLMWEGHAIQVNDVKFGNTNHSQTSPSRQGYVHQSKNGNLKEEYVYTPVQLPYRLLPINEEVTVEVVEHLPCSSINNSVFALTVRMNDDKGFNSYELMTEKMIQYNQLIQFQKKRLEVGFDCLFKPTPQTAYRARKINGGELYLVDEGSIVRYDKFRCFHLHKQFTNLPMRISLCALDGMTWASAAIGTFSKIREVIKTWGASEKDNLKVVNLGFRGPLNMVSIYGQNSVLAERLQRRGICEYIPRDLSAQRFYSREDLMKLKLNEYNPKLEPLENDVLKDLVKDLSNVSISSSN